MRRRTTAGALLGLVLCFAGCHETAPAGGGWREVVDGLGRRLRMPASPKRIVSLAPGVTESLLALDFGDRLVGVCDFCRLPAALGSVRRVGGMLNPSLETLRDLRPDLLVATTSGNDPALAGQAATLGLPLYTVHMPDVATTVEALARLAEALGVPARGRALAGRLAARLEAVSTRVRPLRPARVLFIVWSEPLLVPGGPSYLTDVMARAGGVSVTADVPSAWPTFDLESAVARRPEVILTTAQNRAFIERLPREAAWAQVPAVRSRRIYVVGDDVQQPGPGVVAGVEEVARLLHPDAFTDGRAEGGPSARPAGPRRGDRTE